MGGEVLLLGLGGCFMSNLLAAAAARNVEIAGATVDISATIAPSPSRFTAVDMQVGMTCDPPGEAQKLVEIAERGCLVANTLKRALSLDIRIEQR
jgi:putative redox protein